MPFFVSLVPRPPPSFPSLAVRLREAGRGPGNEANFSSSSLFLNFFVQPSIMQQRYLANGLSTYRHFSTKLILLTTRSSTSTQRLDRFKFTLVNKSHSQHSVVAVRCEGRHFLICKSYACAHEVSFPGQIPRSLVWERHWCSMSEINCARLAVSSRSSGQGLPTEVAPAFQKWSGDCK